MNELKLPELTHVGAVHLRVQKISNVYDFYTGAVGLVELPSDGPHVHLGLGDRLILVLEEDSTLRAPAQTDAGLFHVAILFDSPRDLALSLLRTLTKYQVRYRGSGDHLVSQAFYFSDPEGNGVELYVDRPREAWTWKAGEVQMDTLYIDPVQFIQGALTEEEIATAMERNLALGGRVGHVHLQVGDVKTARQFYVDIMGFDQTAHMGNSAVFVSAGGYHHHMAMNVWNSRGAGPRAKTLGLGVVDLFVPDEDGLGLLDERLARHGVERHFDGRDLVFVDPWNNTLRARIGS